MNDNRASGMIVIRLVVCGYLIYLGASLIMDQLNGVSAIAPWISWASGILFIAAGLFFGLYAWKRYRKGKTDRPEKPEESEE